MLDYEWTLKVAPTPPSLVLNAGFFSFKSPEGEEMLLISQDGFYVRGEKVNDAHGVYEAFRKWIDKAGVTI